MILSGLLPPACFSPEKQNVPFFFSDGAEHPRAGGKTTVDHQRGTVDKGGFIRTEVDGQVGDVLRPAQPPDRIPSDQLLFAAGLSVPVHAGPFGFDGAGADDVGPDALGSVRDRHVLGERNQSRFGRAVAELADAPDGVDRGDVERGP